MRDGLKDYPSLEPKEEPQKDFFSLIRPRPVTVRFPASWHGGNLYLPLKEKTEKSVEIVAEFAAFTPLDEWEMEDMFKVSVKMPNEREPDYVYTEPSLRNVEILRRKLKAWNVGEKPFSFTKDGYLTDECLKEVVSYPGGFISRMISEYEKTFEVTEEELDELKWQCNVLFGTQHGAVDNPNRAVALYCTFSGFWEKLGINMFDLAKLPYRTFFLMRMIMREEGEHQERQMKARASAPAPSKTNLRR